MSKLKSRKLTIALFLFYFLVLFVIVMFKTKFSFRILHVMLNLVDPDIKRSINLIPFGGMHVLNGQPDYGEIILNGLAFIPLGIFLGMLRKKRSFANLVAPIVLTSLLFEAAQYVFALGISDITDVITNTLGGMAGVMIFFALQKVCGRKAYPAINTVALGLAIGFLVVLSTIRPL